MIMNYQLMLSEWLPISVPKEERLKYYEALEAYATGGDIKPFAEFVAELENKELDNAIALIEQSLKQEAPMSVEKPGVEKRLAAATKALAEKTADKPKERKPKAPER
jgi:Fic family protein